MYKGVRRRLGALILDWPRFEWRMRNDWSRICNRAELLEAAPHDKGMRCCWQWTTDLHLARLFPSFGGRLMQRALRDWPVRFAEQPEVGRQSDGRDKPLVSFIIGHRGRQRLPHLLATLRTIAAQREVDCECIVVEQSNEPEIESSLPAWARYVHTPLPQADMPYCRSWTLNVGAVQAEGQLLVLHDNDMLVPERYAAELWQRHREGFDVINLKRFIFYLWRADTERFFENGGLDPRACSESIVQNLEAGGSLAISREAFMAIGGFDESFIGWGGEDNEFWERARTRPVWNFGYLPIVHLWHAAQPRKGDPENPAVAQYHHLSARAPAQRIEELRSRPFGRREQLSVPYPDR